MRVLVVVSFVLLTAGCATTPPIVIDDYFNEHKSDASRQTFSLPAQQLANSIIAGGSMVFPGKVVYPSTGDWNYKYGATSLSKNVLRLRDPEFGEGNQCGIFLEPRARETEAAVVCCLSGNRKYELRLETAILSIVAQRVAQQQVLAPTSDPSQTPETCGIQDELAAQQEADEHAFGTALRSKHATDEELPEEALKYSVQANAAVKRQDFATAAIRYGQALRAAPWWAAGRYNRALILAKVHCEPEAISEMKRYLKLGPNAADERKAKNKIYEWEDLTAQETSFKTR